MTSIRSDRFLQLTILVSNGHPTVSVYSASHSHAIRERLVQANLLASASRQRVSERIRPRTLPCVPLLPRRCAGGCGGSHEASADERPAGRTKGGNHGSYPSA